MNLVPEVINQLEWAQEMPLPTYPSLQKSKALFPIFPYLSVIVSRKNWIVQYILSKD